jgi:Transposase DDE domain
MTHESLLNAGWLKTIGRLGGAERLEKEAREVGAFRRVREVKCAVDLLRLTLAYCLGAMGLRLTAAWAETVGLASLSNVALLKRLRKSVPWLEILVGRLIGAGAGRAVASAGRGRLIRIVDATVVAKKGRASREAGGLWRVHAVFDLPSERFSAFELTDESEGERFDRAAVVAGEIRIGDRAYLQPDRIANVLAAGADILVRAKWNGARWVDANCDGIDLIQLLKKARGKGLVDRPIWIKATGPTPIALRVVAIRKPKQARDATIERITRDARDNGRTLQPETLIAAEWLILVTSLDRDEFSLPAIGDLYRLRWRIEIDQSWRLSRISDWIFEKIAQSFPASISDFDRQREKTSTRGVSGTASLSRLSTEGVDAISARAEHAGAARRAIRSRESQSQLLGFCYVS